MSSYLAPLPPEHPLTWLWAVGVTILKGFIPLHVGFQTEEQLSPEEEGGSPRWEYDVQGNLESIWDAWWLVGDGDAAILNIFQICTKPFF